MMLGEGGDFHNYWPIFPPCVMSRSFFSLSSSFIQYLCEKMRENVWEREQATVKSLPSFLSFSLPFLSFSPLPFFLSPSSLSLPLYLSFDVLYLFFPPY